MYDQRLTEAYRPIWSPGLFELNLKSLQPPTLETAVIMGELAGGGSVAVAVGFSDKLKVTGDKEHVTHYA